LEEEEKERKEALKKARQDALAEKQNAKRQKLN